MCGPRPSGGPCAPPPLKSCQLLVSRLCLHRPVSAAAPGPGLLSAVAPPVWIPYPGVFLAPWKTRSSGHQSQPFPLQVGKCRQEMLDGGTGVQTPQDSPPPIDSRLFRLWSGHWGGSGGGSGSRGGAGVPGRLSESLSLAPMLLRGLSGSSSRWSCAGRARGAIRCPASGSCAPRGNGPRPPD